VAAAAVSRRWRRLKTRRRLARRGRTGSTTRSSAEKKGLRKGLRGLSELTSACSHARPCMASSPGHRITAARTRTSTNGTRSTSLQTSAGRRPRLLFLVLACQEVRALAHRWPTGAHNKSLGRSSEEVGPGEVLWNTNHRADLPSHNSQRLFTDWTVR